MPEEQSFDFMFQILPILIGIFFVFVIGAILFTIIKGISQWNKNNNSPETVAKARIVAKRSEVHGGGETSAYTHYFVTFEMENGDRMEFQVKDLEYGMLAEGDQGELKFRGTRYLGYKRTANVS
ncbi:DUF2500 domain-containing protein [Peribacillus kribbensis]|uniref:DUF2500 domain-containing protein n=1 Tax=Peribacillus kribbensis TaxID=356658 RepID=UPI0004125A21|nr:DUF2500 domain-containing protein [Peribacillus kribbensis]